LKNAFEAGSLLGLVNQIVVGKVERIPAMYSAELWMLV